MEGKLTLEKLRIAERVSAIEAKFDNFKEWETVEHKNLKEKIDDIHQALVGDKGLIIKVDRHEQTIRNWSDSIKVVWIAIAGLAVKAFWGLFNRNG